MVGFKLSNDSGSALGTLTHIGGAGQCRSQQVSAFGFRFSGCVDALADLNVIPAQRTASSHVWAVLHDGMTSVRSYWNGAHFSNVTASLWSTVDSPLYVGRGASGASNNVLIGGVRFVLLLNRKKKRGIVMVEKCNAFLSM